MTQQTMFDHVKFAHLWVGRLYVQLEAALYLQSGNIARRQLSQIIEASAADARDLGELAEQRQLRFNQLLAVPAAGAATKIEKIRRQVFGIKREQKIEKAIAPLDPAVAVTPQGINPLRLGQQMFGIPDSRCQHTHAKTAGG